MTTFGRRSMRYDDYGSEWALRFGVLGFVLGAVGIGLWLCGGAAWIGIPVLGFAMASFGGAFGALVVRDVPPFHRVPSLGDEILAWDAERARSSASEGEI